MISSSNTRTQERENTLSLSLHNSSGGGGVYRKRDEEDEEMNEFILNPITSPFKVYSNYNNSLYGTGNSIIIGSNFYIISAAGQLNNNITTEKNIYNNDSSNNLDVSLNNLNREMLISVGSSGEQIKVIKLFVIESVNIGVSYSIHNLPFTTNFINEIGRVRIKKIESASLLYREGLKIKKNGIASGFTQGIIIKNLSKFFIANPEFSKTGDCGSLVINDDNCVIGVLLSSNQDHTIIAKLELFEFLFK